MKTFFFVLFCGIITCSGSQVSGQVFGHSGATWVFYNQPFWAVCFEGYEKWEYVADTSILGIGVKDIKVTSKYESIMPGFQTYIYHKYFQVNDDTVSIFRQSDSTWWEVYNFSLSIGDTTFSPLRNRMGFGFECNDTIPYFIPALVVDTGSAMIAGASLRYYTIKYRIGQYPGDDFTDTVYAYQTYYERIITNSGYWYPPDNYLCGEIAECEPLLFVCYRDYDMILDSACNHLSWFDNLAIPDVKISTFNIHPNPASNFLVVQTDQTESMNFDILSVDGKLMMSGIQSPINVENLPPGIYFITDQNRTRYRKFIKN